MEQDFYNQPQENVPPPQVPPLQEPPPPPLTSMPPFWKSKRFLLGLVSLIILMMIGSVTYFLATTRTVPATKTVLVPTPTSITHPTPTIAQTTKTFSNDSIGFTFDYPLDWTIKETTSDVVTQLELSGKEGSIHIAWGASGVGGGCGGVQETIVSKTETFTACHYKKPDGLTQGYSGIYKSLSQASTFTATAEITNPAEQNRDVILSIIKSFSFTTPVPTTDTSAWKPYTSSPLSLSFSYPSPSYEVNTTVQDGTALKADSEVWIGKPGTDSVLLQIYYYKSSLSVGNWWSTVGEKMFDTYQEDYLNVTRPKPTNIPPPSFTLTQAVFAGQPALNVVGHVEAAQAPQVESLTIVQYKNGIYLFRAMEEGKDSALEAQVMNTLQFLK